MAKMSIIIGAQWGDEGKGKIVDYLSREADIVVRYNGGNNAGHTVVVNGERYPLSLLPSGVLWKRKLLIAQGTVINPSVLLREIEFFSSKKLKVDLTIDARCNIVMPYHQWLDAATEDAKGDKKVGSLKLGIGYCYEDRNNRHGIRLEDLINPVVLREKLMEEYQLKAKRLIGVYGFKPLLTPAEIYSEFVKYGNKLKKYIGDVSKIVHENPDKQILFEGAHGTFLDANFGTYPFTTAVNTVSGGVFSYVGIPPKTLNVIGVVKAYTTRVGGGPFPAELFDDSGLHMQEKGGEIGTVSKRKRRCGWLDLPMLRLSNRLNGFSSITLTKVDVLSGLKELKVVTYYQLGKQKIFEFPSALSDLHKIKPVYEKLPGWKEDLSQYRRFNDLPVNCRNYIRYIREKLGVKINMISVSPERDAIIKVY